MTYQSIALIASAARVRLLARVRSPGEVRRMEENWRKAEDRFLERVASSPVVRKLAERSLLAWAGRDRTVVRGCRLEEVVPVLVLPRATHLGLCHGDDVSVLVRSRIER